MENHLQEMGEYLRRMGERLRRLDEQLSHLEAEDDKAVDRGRGWPTGGSPSFSVGRGDTSVNARRESNTVRDLIGDGLKLCRVLEMAFREHSGC